MAKAKTQRPAPAHDWYLPEWLKQYGKIQADLETDLEWNKSKASLMIRGKQRYHRDDVNQVAQYLNLQPYELLMHPADAMAIRQLRIDARKLALTGPPFEVMINDEGKLRRVAEPSVGFSGIDHPRNPGPIGARARRKAART